MQRTGREMSEEEGRRAGNRARGLRPRPVCTQGPGWGRDGKANGEDFLQKEEEGKSDVYLGKGKGEL